MAGRVIQGFFAGGGPRFAAHVVQSPPVPWGAVQPKAMSRLPGPPALAFAGRPPVAQPKTTLRQPGPPVPAFAGRQPVAQAKTILRQPGPPAPAFATRSPTVQARGTDNSFQVDPARLGLMSGGGKPLPDAVRGQMEAALGADFSAVRVHVGPQAERIGAVAFTTGNDLYFAPGRFQPDTIQGKQLLGHELAHVVQQRQRRVRNPSGAGVAVVQDRALETEADVLGRRASTFRPALNLGTMQRASVVRPDRALTAEIVHRPVLFRQLATRGKVSLELGAATGNARRSIQRVTSFNYNQPVYRSGISLITGLNHQRVQHNDSHRMNAAILSGYPNPGAAVADGCRDCNHHIPYRAIAEAVREIVINMTVQAMVEWLIRLDLEGPQEVIAGRRFIRAQRVSELVPSENGFYLEQELHKELDILISDVANDPRNLFYWPESTTDLGGHRWIIQKRLLGQMCQQVLSPW